MEPHQTGIMVTKVLPLFQASSQLRKYDVLLSIDGTPIGNDATVAFSFNFTFNFKYNNNLIQKIIIGK